MQILKVNLVSPYLDLFSWWVTSISWSTVFLIIISIYLYRKSNKISISNIDTWVKDFMFIWVLISLLIFYIISVNIGSSVIFAAGNIIVEIVLIIYVVKSKKLT